MNVHNCGGGVDGRVDQGSVSAPALVVQQDGGLILDTGAPAARSVADGLRRFATLEKCPGTFHHYRITRRSLWNAAASGVTAQRITDFLCRASRLPVPPAVEALIAEAMARHGRLRLVREGGQLWLRTGDPALLHRLAPDLIPDFLPGIEALGEDGLALSPSARGPLKARLA